MPRLTKVLTGLAVTACAAVAPASAMALPGAHVSSTKLVKHVEYPGTQHLHYEYGPIDITPGPEQHRRQDQSQQAEGPGLHHPLRAEPRVLRHAQGAPSRRDPSAPRGLAQQRLSHVRRRRGEDVLPASAGIRLSLQPERPLDHELHDPQPHAGAHAGVDHLRHRLRAGQHRRGQDADPGAPALDGRGRPARLPGVRRASRVRASAGSSPSRTRRRALPRRPPSDRRHEYTARRT